MCFRKNMYVGGDSQMNGDMPHDGGHGGGGHAVGDELQKTGRYGVMTIQTPILYCNSVKKQNSEAPPSAECETKVVIT